MSPPRLPLRNPTLIYHHYPPLNRDFISKVAPRLAYANPSVNFDIKHRSTPVTKAKDPELQKRAEESAKQIQETGTAPSLTVEFRMSLLPEEMLGEFVNPLSDFGRLRIDDAPSTTIRLQQQMDTSRILNELVALAEGRSTLVQTAAKA